MSLAHNDTNGEATPTVKPLERAKAYDKYFEMAQFWDVEGAERIHRAEKDAARQRVASEAVIDTYTREA